MSLIVIKSSLLLPLRLQKLLVVVATDVEKLVVVAFRGPCSIVLSPPRHYPTQVRTFIGGRSDDNNDRSLDSTTTETRA